MNGRSRKLGFFIAISLCMCAAVGAAIAINGYISGTLSGGTTPNSTALEKKGQTATDLSVPPTQYQAAAPNDFSETLKLVDPTPAAAAQMGFSVAVSGDTAIVGVPGKANNRGSAFIFVKNGATWTLQQELIGADSIADDNFGWSVAMSGETAIVGAYDLNEVDQGAAYVFVRNGLTWSQQQKLLPAGGAISDQFGSSVSLSGDSAIVGAFGKDNSRGAAYVYFRTGSTWAQQQILTASDGAAGDEFGWSVGISGDRAVAGAPGDDSFRGSAYVFTRNGTIWTQTAKAVSNDGAPFDRFGYSTAIDANYLIAGAPLDSDNGILSGSAYAFVENGGSWQQQAKLLAGDRAANDKFGTSVAITGTSTAVGSSGDDIGSNIDQGSAYLFTRTNSEWTQVQKLSGSDSLAGDNFGGAVSLSFGILIAGSYLDDGGSGQDAGSAYIFTQPVQSSPTPTPSPTSAVASVSGQVFTSEGHALRSAQVRITDVVLGSSVTTITSTLGYFEFQVENGRDYVITVSSRRYRFSSMPISVNGDVLGIEMMGLE